MNIGNLISGRNIIFRKRLKKEVRQLILAGDGT